MDLQDLGWDAPLADAFLPYEREGLIAARVVARHHGPCELLSELGRLGGLPARYLRDAELPAVGDWVAARLLPGEQKAVVVAVLPRQSALRRKEAWRRTVEQIVAANVDVVVVVTAFGHDVNPRRLERHLTAVRDGGARPVIAVNKLDRARAPERQLAAIASVAPGVPVHAVSAATGKGLAALAARLEPRRTAALVGSSGVGKSTLLNRLAGRHVARTGATSAGGRGRHVTAHRRLVVLPSGSLVIDTPGMRELQLWAGEEALDATFAEVAELAAGCRFADCAHESEPGCAVKDALAAGRLREERLESYRKLQHELRALAARRRARRAVA